MSDTYAGAEVKSRSVSKMTISLLPSRSTLAGTYNWFAPEEAAEESRGEGKRRGGIRRRSVEEEEENEEKEKGKEEEEDQSIRGLEELTC
jgi:hypothetical protein